MTEVVCVANHPIDLDDGRTLEPGESADVDTNHQHNQTLLDNGDLLAMPVSPSTNVAEPTPQDTPAPPATGTVGIFEGRPGGEEV